MQQHIQTAGWRQQQKEWQLKIGAVCGAGDLMFSLVRD